MLDCFNKHFVAAGSLFQIEKTIEINNDMDYRGRHLFDLNFSFKHFTICQVQKAPKLLDVNKSAGPDQLEPLFLRLAADFIATPLTFFFFFLTFTVYK